MEDGKNLISRLSEIRSDYNCFDENEESYYRALSEVIKILSQRADGDTISRQAAIDVMCELMHHWFGGDSKDEIREIKRELGKLPSAQPDNQINLCDNCKYLYPDCPSKNDDVIFGNGVGNDNICACNKYKPSAQLETCNGCEWEYAFGYGECHHCKRHYDDMYKRKEGEENG